MEGAGGGEILRGEREVWAIGTGTDPKTDVESGRVRSI